MSEKIKKLLSASVVRFAIVGAVNTAVGSAIMFGAYNFLNFEPLLSAVNSLAVFGVHTLPEFSYWVSSAANYVLTSILSFFLNKYFTFRNKERSALQALRFAVNIAVCYFIAYGIAKPAVAAMLSGYSEAVRGNVAMLTGMVLFTVINYCGQRFFAFGTKKTGADNNA